MLVVIEVVRAGIVGDVQIGPTVVIVIAPDRAQAVVFVGIVDACLFGNFFKRAVAAIVKEQVGFPEHAPGSALHRDSLEAAVLLVLAEVRQFIHVKVNVAGDEKIYVSVTIVVSPGRAGAEAARGHAGFIRDIFKLAVAQIVIQRVAAVAGHIDVGQTVVVVIGDRDAHAPAFAGQSGRLGDVSEFETIVLVIERDHGIAALLVAVDGRSVHRDDVEFAVIVAIDQAGAAAHRFDDVTFLWRRNVRDGQTDLFGDVFEFGQRQFRGSALRRCNTRKHQN